MNGFSNSCSHFDSETRECSSWIGVPPTMTNSCLESSYDSTPPTLISSILWPFCQELLRARRDERQDLVRKRQPRHRLRAPAVPRVLERRQRQGRDDRRIDDDE